MKFKRIIYLISATVLITVAIQVYRNVQNYQLNKQRFVIDVQQALDLSIEAYFADRVRDDIIVFTPPDSMDSFHIMDRKLFQASWATRDSATPVNRDLSFVGISDLFKATGSVRVTGDSLAYTFSSSNHKHDSIFESPLRGISRIDLTSEIDLSDSNQLKGFAKKIMFSLTNNQFDIDRLSQFVEEELKRKSIEVKFALVYKNPRLLGLEEANKYYALSTSSKSTYLPKNRQLNIQFENASLNILKRGALDLFISLLISGAVIGSLLYLYRVITEQKQLAEIKNDLISNITHEFKTPIATVSTAIEAISNFNQANDPVKTAKYLDISTNQLSKLNGMVEKLLETASLDSDDLEINVERVELVRFTQQIFEKFHLIKGDKKLSFQTDLVEEWQQVDPFHMENALSNLVDNAIKYGGEEVTFKLSKAGEGVFWEVMDNGGKIEKQQQQLIFDKFYRIPTGNVHDVKGFGIGLYYTKKIVEKHHGEIILEVSNDTTVFRIQI